MTAERDEVRCRLNPKWLIHVAATPCCSCQAGWSLLSVMKCGPACNAADQANPVHPTEWQCCAQTAVSNCCAGAWAVRRLAQGTAGQVYGRLQRHQVSGADAAEAFGKRGVTGRQGGSPCQLQLSGSWQVSLVWEPAVMQLYGHPDHGLVVWAQLRHALECSMNTH